MAVVLSSTDPIWPNSHAAPLATQLLSPLKTVSAPAPATEPTAEPAAEPTAEETPDSTWHTGPRPRAARDEAAEGHEVPGMVGRMPTTPTSVDARSGVVEEIDD